ncbi:neutral/alkaline non-lysosomal ceramidase N-terminal domain-containing protein, partial [bacterium]|nr:neutral/alkaline non-lysosomal ceramidase N-terminal domain-containing protein [bacterium]
MDSELRVGTGKIDITPPAGVAMDGNPRNKGSQGIHDPLYAKVLFLDDGKISIAAITLDLLGLYRENVNSIRSKIEDSLGIRKNNILISSSHTHSGPCTLGLFCEPDNAWLSVLEDRILNAVHEAKANMEIVQVGAGTGKEGTIGHQRRLKMADGSIRMNWENFSPEDVIDPAGPIDPQVGVIKFQRRNGALKAIFINHTCHPNILAGENYLFTADYPGYAMEIIEKETGSIAFFTNGALGDIDIDPLKERGFQGAEKAGKTLAEEVLRVIKNIQVTNVDGLKFLQ